MFILLNRRPTQWFILVSAFVMFALSTADISITFQYMTHDIIDVLDQDGSLPYPVLKSLFVKNLIFVSNKSVLKMMSIASISLFNQLHSGVDLGKYYALY